MINKLIVASIFVTAGFACAQKDYRSSSSQTSTTHSAPQSSEHNVVTESEMNKSEFKDFDNTAMNKRDGNEDRTLTPTDQSAGSKADVELTRKIRKAITESDTLSTSAQNVKIITLKGITTLRGPVNTAAEKMKVEQLAKIAGAKEVKNQLEVTTKTE